MSDTPETDLVAAYDGNWDTKALRMTNHARKLERERDEARNECKALWKLVEIEKKKAYNSRQERDEARETLSHLRACVFDALSALEAGAFEELKKAWEETK